MDGRAGTAIVIRATLFCCTLTIHREGGLYCIENFLFIHGRTLRTLKENFSAGLQFVLRCVLTTYHCHLYRSNSPRGHTYHYSLIDSRFAPPRHNNNSMSRSLIYLDLESTPQSLPKNLQDEHLQAWKEKGWLHVRTMQSLFNKSTIFLFFFENEKAFDGYMWRSSWIELGATTHVGATPSLLNSRNWSFHACMYSIRRRACTREWGGWGAAASESVLALSPSLSPQLAIREDLYMLIPYNSARSLRRYQLVYVQQVRWDLWLHTAYE